MKSKENRPKAAHFGTWFFVIPLLAILALLAGAILTHVLR